jgi:outer membrane protein
VSRCLAPRAALAALLAAASSTAAAEEVAGDIVVQAGWFHVMPQDSSTPLRTRLAPSLLGTVLGIEPEFVSEGTSTSVANAGTPAFTVSYFLTDHLVIKAEGGMPAEFEVSGSGVVRPTGLAGSLISIDLGDPANNPLASAKQWSPALLLQYYFRDPGVRLRPFLGVGGTYTWFTDEELDPDFEDNINRSFGVPLALAAGRLGPTRVEAKSTPSWAPIANAGFAFRLAERWSLSASVSYVGLSTTSKIKLSAADGTRLATSETDIDVNPLVASLLLSYRLGGDD